MNLIRAKDLHIIANTAQNSINTIMMDMLNDTMNRLACDGVYRLELRELLMDAEVVELEKAGFKVFRKTDPENPVNFVISWESWVE